MKSLKALDNDAQNFISSANIIDYTQKVALHNLCVSLKKYNLWTKMKAVYPFIGGTAFRHKFNLIDPRDLDVAFRLTFSGGITHSSTGALPNGTNGYANTYLNPSTNLIQYNTHISYYSRTNNSLTQTEIKAYSSDTSVFALSIRYLGTLYSDHYSYTIGRISVSNSDSRGYYISSRLNDSLHIAYKNGINIVSSSTTTTSTLPTSTLKLFTNENITNFSTKESAFISIGYGLSDTDALNLYNLVQSYNTSLSRQV